MPAFEKEEYQVRIGKVRQSMEEKNIEVLIVTDPSNMAWLTGYGRLVVLCSSVCGANFGG